MNFGNRLVEFYEGEGKREVYRGSAEPDYSTREAALIVLWDRHSVEKGTMTVPYDNLKEIDNIKAISGFILWVEIAYGDDDKPIGVSSLERAEWMPEHDIDIDYFK